MKTLFVNQKSELTRKKEEAEIRGYEVFRSRCACNCKQPHNRRHAVLITRGSEIVSKVIKCKACEKGGKT